MNDPSRSNRDAPFDIARLTPAGRGAIATLRAEGPAAIDAVGAVFRPANGRPLAEQCRDRPVFGRFGDEPGEEMVVRLADEGAVELHCHGGTAVVAMVLETLAALGAVEISWQDWTRRRDADPIAAAARLALADAATERTAAILVDQLQGALRRSLERMRDALDCGHSDAAARHVRSILIHAPLGLRLARPWKVVLAGLPNAGKSTLINRLLGYDRAIVHAAPGTTRDVVTAATALDGWPVELSDTAGLRVGEHALEQEGIARAEARLAAADLVVLVIDRSQPRSEVGQGIAERFSTALVVHNKSDLPAAEIADAPPGIPVSGLRGEGIEQLAAAIAERLVPSPPPPGAAVPFADDQVARLEEIGARLAAGELAAARAALLKMLECRA